MSRDGDHIIPLCDLYHCFRPLIMTSGVFFALCTKIILFVSFPLAGYLWDECASIFSITFIGSWEQLLDLPHAPLFQAELSQIPQLQFVHRILQICSHLGGPLLGPLQCQHIKAPHLETEFQMFHACRGMHHFLNLLATFLLMQPSTWLAFTASRTHCWLRFSLSSTSVCPPTSSTSKAGKSWGVP